MWEYIMTTDPKIVLSVIGGAVVVLLVLAIFLLSRRRLRAHMEGRNRWVLLATEAGSRSDALLLAFQQAGWDAQILPSGVGLGEFLGGFHPSLLVLDPGLHGAELMSLEANDARVASTPVVLLGDLPVDRKGAAMRSWVGKNARNKDILKAGTHLVSLIPGPNQLSRRNEVQGPISPGTLLELLYFLANAQRTGRVEIRTAGFAGWIWIEKGEIRHCHSGRSEGVKALHALLDLVQGRFGFRSGVGAPKVTVRDSTVYLLHEYARLRDERAKMAGH